jgi:hypothetical protein
MKLWYVIEMTRFYCRVLARMLERTTLCRKKELKILEKNV